MKINKLLFPLTGMLLLASCQEKPAPQPGPGPEEENDPVVLELVSTFGDTKTVLGQENAGVYPVYWTDGDRVCVNGVKSSTVYGLGSEAEKADFEVKGVTAPYHIIYPSIICDRMDEEGIASITIPKAQLYTPGSFASGSAILYSETEGGSCELRNLCGVVRIPIIKGSEWGGTLGGLSIASKSSEQPLSGVFSLNTVSGALSAISADATAILSLPASGIKLDASIPEYFYIAIPGGLYEDGFTLTLSSEEGNMLCEWVGQTAVPAGIMVTLPQLAFVPNNTKLIDGIDSWNEFATAVNNNDYKRWLDPQTGEANVVADISYGGDLTMINELPAGFVLNGGGHTIKRANATEPLVLLVAEGATIKNLNIGGSRVGRSASSADDRGTGNLAAFNRGVIDNCTSDMSIVLNNLDCPLKIGGLVTDNAGLISNCKNTGDITVTFNISANRNVYGGGIAAISHRNLSGVQFCGSYVACENKGNIIINRSATGSYNLTRFALGGIVGTIEQGSKDGVYTVLKDCVNSGNIVYYQDAKHTSANYGYAVGGLVGRNNAYNAGPDFYYYIGGATATAYDGYYFEMENCHNTGSIDASIFSGNISAGMSGARQAYIGGLMGCLQSVWSAPAVIKDCSARCDIRTGTSAMAECTGGLFGGAGQATISGCKADVRIGFSNNTLNAPTQMGVIGGAVGFVCRDLTIQNCEVNLVFDHGTATKVYGAAYAALVAKNANISQNVATSGMATLTLEGDNVFSGTIDGVAVKEENTTLAASLGRVVGYLTVK